MTGMDTVLYAGWEAEAATAEIPFTWIEESGVITLTGYTGDSCALTVPTSIGGVPVTAIADEAFAGLPIRSIDLGMVAAIGESALSGCEMLSGITLPDTLTELGDYAFSGCTAPASRRGFG